MKKIALVPVDVDDNTLASGVDDVSITADPTDIGYQSKFWIMAPAGNDPAGNRCSNSSQIKVLVEPASELRMDCTHARCDYVKLNPPNADILLPPIPIGNAVNPMTVSWRGTGAESGDHEPVPSLGNSSRRADLPIRVKTMKRRTVKIVVWPVSRPGMPEIFADNAAGDAFEASLQTKLNEIFAYQTNAWCDVTVKPSGTFDYLDGATAAPSSTPYTLRHGTKEKAMIDAYRDGSQDVNVFLINNVLYTGDSSDPHSSVKLGSSYPAGFPGAAGRENCVVVNMSALYTQGTNQMHTIAHEIGHLMVGPGHPDQWMALLPDLGGPAPLQSIPAHHPSRLMHSNSGTGTLLVKGEWDRAEIWLSKRPNGDN
jgi:hypothetical protein